MQWKFRFSLRTWLVLFTAAAVGCYWVLVPAMRQQRAIELVHVLAGQGTNPEHWENFTHQPVKFRVFDAQHPPTTTGEWIQRLLCQQVGYKYFGTVEEVSLADAPLDDNDLRLLADLRGLRSLNLSGAQINDAALVHVAKCASLTKLSIAFAPITDEGIEHLSGLRNLESLTATGTHITDSAIPLLRKMPSLATVGCYKTNVSREGEASLGMSARPRRKSATSW